MKALIRQEPVSKKKSAKLVKAEKPPRSSSANIHSNLLKLGHTIGNRAMGRLIQTMLTIGAPNDKHEQEADRVADQVISTRLPGVPGRVDKETADGEELAIGEIQTKTLTPTITPKIKLGFFQIEREIQTKTLTPTITPLAQSQSEPEEGEDTEDEKEEEEEPIQAKQCSHKPTLITGRVNRRIQSLKGAGQPLSRSEQAFFEPRFGVDFSQVHVHTDGRSAHIARSINARAFTLGKDIVFANGQYAPNTEAGKQLLAHELTHVVQQRSVAPRLQRATDVAIGCFRDNAQACLVHLHRSEPQALQAALRLFARYCVNLVYIADPHNRRVRPIRVDAGPGPRGRRFSCLSDPNRIFNEAGVRSQWNRWNSGICMRGRYKEMAIRAMTAYGVALRHLIDRCRHSAIHNGRTPTRPVFALHNYGSSGGGLLGRFRWNGSYNVPPNRATALPDRAEDRRRLLYIYQQLRAHPTPPTLPSSCPPPLATTSPSDQCLREINPYMPPRTQRDFFLVTRVNDFIAFALQGRNVVLQARNPSNDGSLSVILAQDRYINLETYVRRGLRTNIRQAEAALAHLSVGRGCTPPPACSQGVP